MPYPSSTYPKATVSSSGCGPTVAAMVVSNLTNKIVQPPEMAAFSISSGARAATGTDMGILSKSIAKKYGLSVKMSNSISEMCAAVKDGAYAVCNVGGDRSGYMGVFSSGGHYVLCVESSGDSVVIADPYLYTTKYSSAYRRKYVTQNGNLLSCSKSVLDKDCDNRSPRYYIFTK